MTRAAALLVVLALAGCSAAVESPAPPSVVPSTPGPVRSASPSASSAAFVTGMTIPWAVGGERIRADGTTGNDPGEWPTFPVAATRLWDTRTTWLNLEPADDRWNWTTLDGHLAKAAARGVDDVTLVLGGTPQWAAQRVSADDAPWLGPGSASPPRDMAQWREYVSTVATRYRGRIGTYEIGNEPNLVMFWNGSPTEYADLVAAAIEEVHRADPAARVVVDAGLVRRPDDLPSIARWLQPALAAAEAADVRPDAVSVHVYPSVAEVGSVIDLLLAARAAVRDVADLPVWVTEANVRDGSSLPPDEQQRVVADLPRAAEAADFERLYWYAWTDLGPKELIQFGPGTPGGMALRSTAVSPQRHTVGQ